ncbi:MAG: hypothetical protein RR645_02695 [Clostridium sp.]
MFNNTMLILLVLGSMAMVVNLIMKIVRRAKVSKELGSLIYNCKLEKVAGKVSSIILIIVIVYFNYKIFLNTYFGVGIKGGFWENYMGLESLVRMNYLVILIIAITMVMYQAVSIFLHGRIFEEGILISSGKLILFDNMKRIEYKLSLLETYYEIKIYGIEKKCIGEIYIKLDEIDKVISIINKNTSAEILKKQVIQR